VAAKVRDSLEVSKQAAHKFNGERFNLNCQTNTRPLKRVEITSFISCFLLSGGTHLNVILDI